jgi:hypothetical protein
MLTFISLRLLGQLGQIHMVFVTHLFGVENSGRTLLAELLEKVSYRMRERI